MRKNTLSGKNVGVNDKRMYEEEITVAEKSIITGEQQKRAILVVSFGTSYHDTREKTIGAVEEALRVSFPDFDIRRAFTSQIIINILKERDHLEIDNVEGAMKKLAEEGYDTVVIQPTHVMSGYEYEKLVEKIQPYKNLFGRFSLGTPLLTAEEDYHSIVKILSDSTREYDHEKTAFVFMGHGTGHEANADYMRLDQFFKLAGWHNYMVGTVEAVPALEDVISEVKRSVVSKVVLIPFMIVAGDHANNDMAGDEEGSWKMGFQTEGYDVECILKGLGEYEEIRRLFVQHAAEAVERLSRQY